MIVPSVWNNEPGMLEYEGAVWYEKDFFTKGGNLRFSFGAVMTEAKIYLDGELLGEHYGGFCKSSFTKCDVSEGYHKLIVKVDNRFDQMSIPHSVVDWYHYGGITRSVTIERLSGIAVLYSFLDYSIEGDAADCKLRVELYNSKNEPIADTLHAFIDSEKVCEGVVSLKAYETKSYEYSFKLQNIQRWSCDFPKLYELRTETSTDDLYDRIGFRTLEIRDKKFLLNGKETLIRGVNRHEDHPDFGMAFPAALMSRDLDIIEGMNCNSIRGSHYPNSKVFIDMLDERGILFWSEVPMW